MKLGMVVELAEEGSIEGSGVDTFCAWCGRYRKPNGLWGYPAFTPFPHNASHGICPSCVEQLTAEDSCR
jgi:hypothetical protein